MIFGGLFTRWMKVPISPSAKHMSAEAIRRFHIFTKDPMTIYWKTAKKVVMIAAAETGIWLFRSALPIIRNLLFRFGNILALRSTAKKDQIRSLRRILCLIPAALALGMVNVTPVMDAEPSGFIMLRKAGMRWIAVA